ncbi:hypothetical protein D9M70_614170 [compost metagenome]
MLDGVDFGEGGATVEAGLGLLVVTNGEASLVFQAQTARELALQTVDDFADITFQGHRKSGLVLAQLGQVVLGVAQQHREDRGGCRGRGAIVAVADGGIDLVAQGGALGAFQYGEQPPQSIAGVAGVLVKTHG